jgi:hypothetical protein
VPPHPHRIPRAPARRGHLRLLDESVAEARLRAVVAEDEAGIRRLLAAVLELDDRDSDLDAGADDQRVTPVHPPGPG